MVNQDCDIPGEKYFLYVHPRTIGAAVKLAKKRGKLQKHDERGGIVDVVADLKLLKLYSERKNNVDPSDVALLTMIWYTNPCEDDNKKKARMLGEIKKEFRKVGLNFSDYKYDFINEYLW